MRIGIISQARMTSTRLPGKVLLTAAGQPLLHYHAERLRQSGLPLYLAVTTNVQDDVLAAWAAANCLPCVRGDEHDVLSRYQFCADTFGLDVVVRVTSDCPLIDGRLVRAGVDAYLRANDPQLYLSNVLQRTYPRGLDFEVFSGELLREAATHATLASDREHVTPYIHQNRSAQVRFAHITRAADASGFRLTVDTAEDFALARTLIEQHQAAALDAEALIALMQAHPELAAINQHIEQKKL